MGDLRDDFAALRERDQKSAPPFGDLVRERPRGKGVSRNAIVYVLPVATVFAAAAAFVIWFGTRPQAEPPSAAAASHAAAAAPSADPEPLGFLLDEPPPLARFTDFDKEPR